MPKAKHKTGINISSYLTNDWYEKLREAAFKHRVSISELIRVAVMQFITKGEKK